MTAPPELLQDKKLKKLSIIMHRYAPLFIMIGDIERIR